MTATVAPPSPSAMISDSLFARLVSRISSEHGIEPDRAERIVDQALAFLHAAARNRNAVLTPSMAVDIGWHTFLLYTWEYAEFCTRVAGGFIHHVPDDTPGSPTHAPPSTVRTRTLAAIEALGYRVDTELWPVRASRCHDCTEQGCSASDKDGNENTGSRTGGR